MFYGHNSGRSSKDWAKKAPYSWGAIRQSSPTAATTDTNAGWTCGGEGEGGNHASAICSSQIKPITKTVSGTSYTVTSACPFGYMVIGGGCKMEASTAFLASYPEKTLWICSGHGKKSVSAICAAGEHHIIPIKNAAACCVLRAGVCWCVLVRAAVYTAVCCGMHACVPACVRACMCGYCS